MDSEGYQALDISDFQCTTVTQASVEVTFSRTGRRYEFSWNRRELALSSPLIFGDCGHHDQQVIDCLARAVASKASQSVIAKFQPWVDARREIKRSSDFIARSGRVEDGLHGWLITTVVVVVGVFTMRVFLW